MTRSSVLAGFKVVSIGLLLGCGDGDESPLPSPSPGALVQVTTASRVGVLLDELPGDARDRAAADLLARPAEFWTQRAQRQMVASLYRLLFRNFFYTGRGQLPLPPVERGRTPRRDPSRRASDDRRARPGDGCLRLREHAADRAR